MLVLQKLLVCNEFLDFLLSARRWPFGGGRGPRISRFRPARPNYRRNLLVFDEFFDFLLSARGWSFGGGRGPWIRPVRTIGGTCQYFMNSLIFCSRQGGGPSEGSGTLDFEVSASPSEL